MPVYTLYGLDQAGKIERSEPLEANDDREALEAARALERPYDCELWLRTRIVGRVPAGSES